MKNIVYINRLELQGKIGTSRVSVIGQTKYVNFSMFTESVVKTNEGITYNEITWHNVCAFETNGIDPKIFTAEKNTPVNIVGRIRTQKYTGADGTEKIFTEVVASSIKVLEKSENHD